MKSKLLENSAGILFFLFPALLMTVPDGGAITLLLLLVISLSGLVQNRIKVSITSEEKWLFATIAIYFLIFSFNIWYFETKISELDNATRFILLLPIYFFVRKSDLNIGYVTYGILVGAVACFAIASYQVFYLGAARANGITNWVSFGGISISLGLMCFSMGLLSESWRFKVIMFSGFILGSGASILSGSRGSWIALLAGLLFLYIINPKNWSVKTRIITIMVTLLCIISTYMIPSVQNRIDIAIDNVNTFFTEDKANTSVGIRLEAWRGAAIAIADNPVLGIGEGNFRSKMRELAGQGRVNPVVATNLPHAHSEFVSAALHRGIPGLLSLLLLFLIPLMTFLIKLKSIKEDERVLLSSGIMLIIGSMSTSLSDVFFEHHNETLFYATYIYVIYGLIRSHGSQFTTAFPVIKQRI